MMRMIGLTGSFGSGKSTIASMLQEAGIPVVDADELAREVVKPGSKGLSQIKKRFGEEIIHADGTLNRKALSRVVFSDPQALADLEAITHPLIASLMRERFATLEQEGHSEAVYMAPLIFEKKLESLFDATILVIASDAQQLERATKRDGLSEEQARARLESQLSTAEKLAKTVHVIDNSGSLSQSAAQLARIWRILTGKTIDFAQKMP